MYRYMIIAALVLMFALPFTIHAQNQNTQSTIQPSVKTRDRASKAMNNLLHGPTGPCIASSSSREYRNETGTSDQDALPGSGKDIAKIISGAWQFVKFWCADTDRIATTENEIKK